MQQLPLTVRRSIELLGLVLLIAVLYTGNSIIMPIIMAFFMSLLLLPVVNFLRSKRFNEILAITLSIVAAILVFGGIIWFMMSQFISLGKEYPTIVENLKVHWHTLSEWIAANTNTSYAEQNAFIAKNGAKLLDNAGGILGSFAVSLTSVFVFFGLLPIYIFLILFYKNLLLRFVFLWFPNESHERVETALIETQAIVKSYLFGLMIQIAYMTILLGGILLICGIKHAILIGIIFAILNLIPYVGALVGNLIACLLTISSSQELWQVFLVLGVIALVQFVDNNILMPKIVGSKVRINALASIVGVVIGGTIAGPAGMFLSLPIMAVLKLIFDKTDEFKHWGYLLGEDKPKLSPMSNHIVRRSKAQYLKEMEERQQAQISEQEDVKD